MNETDECVLKAIKDWVWSGFYDREQVDAMIGDILDDDADEEMVRAAVAPEFEKKRMAEASWPEVTDCDRLEQAFDELNACRIIALHNAGYTMSEGITEVSEALHRRGGRGFVGYCFYHGQDVERVVADGGLMIAFGAIDDDPAERANVGQLIIDVLRKFGLTAEWNGDPKTRLSIPAFVWQRRTERKSRSTSNLSTAKRYDDSQGRTMIVFWNDQGRGPSPEFAIAVDLEEALEIWRDEVQGVHKNFFGLVDDEDRTIQFYYDETVPNDAAEASHRKIVCLDFPIPEQQGSFGAHVTVGEVQSLIRKAFEVGADYQHFENLTFQLW